VALAYGIWCKMAKRYDVAAAIGGMAASSRQWRHQLVIMKKKARGQRTRHRRGEKYHLGEILNMA
jgi:hypothetical protein